MDNSAIVTQWNTRFFEGDREGTLEYLSDHFQFTGPVPEPIGKEAYVGLMFTLLKAFPDMNNNLTIEGSEGNEVKGTVTMQGTHTADLDLSPMGMPVFPATGNSFKLPKEAFSMTVENGKITQFNAVVGPDGGLMGILGQLGIEIPG